jgi:signal transduction histidine kinase
LNIEQLIGSVDRALAKQDALRALRENDRRYQDQCGALDALKASQERRVEAERLQAVGALTSSVTNYVNNVLQALLGRVQLVLQKLEQPAAVQDLEVGERTILEAAQVLRRLRRFCEVRSLSSAEPMDLNRLVRQAVDACRADREKDAAAGRGRIEVVTELGPIPSVAGQPMVFLEVLSILLANAVEALPGGGQIAIRTWQSDGAVHCVVEDSGVGMSEDVRRRAMEPFFTTKGPERKGLGLSVAYGVVRRHQGAIEITSAEGVGTTVTVHLPLATPVRRNGDRAHLVPASGERS